MAVSSKRSSLTANVRLLLLVVEPSCCRQHAWLLIAHLYLCNKYNPFLFQTITLTVTRYVVVDSALGVSSNSPDFVQRLTALVREAKLLQLLTSKKFGQVGLHHRRQNVYLRNQKSKYYAPFLNAYPSRMRWPPPLAH